MLVVGARGFLGLHVVQGATATDAFEVIRGDRKSAGESGSVEIDIADASSVERAFRLARPDVVILLAAMADIDRCEQSPEQAFAVNARGAENVANECVRAKAQLLFTSTAAVFDGKKHGYREEDAVGPLSVYGKTKAWAENAVKTLLPSAVVIRVALVLGFARKIGTNAMLDALVEKLKAGNEVYLSTLEERNPIDADSLSDAMIGMVADPRAGGLYHLGASDSISRYELGKRLAARAGYSADLVQPQNHPVPGRAPRGEDHFLLTEKIRRVYNVQVKSSDQVIERCFS